MAARRGSEGASEEPRRRVDPALASAALAALHAASYWAAGPVDDDYILHRYARNLLAGHGFAFNPGGPEVEGFSAPLWVALSALAQVIGVAPEAWVRVAGILAAAAAAFAAARAARCLAVARAVRDRAGASAVRAPAGQSTARDLVGTAGIEPTTGARAAWLAGLAVAASPALAFHAEAGLGTVALAACLALAAWRWCASERRGAAPIGAGWWLAVAATIRQDAALAWLPFAAVVLARRQLAAALPGALAVGGWSALRWIVFGRLDPVTYAVKKLPATADLAYGLEYLWRSTLDAAVLPLVLLSLLAALSWREHAVVRAAGAAVVLHAAYVVWVGGDWMALARFFVPILPLALLVAALRIARLSSARACAVAGAALVLALQGGQRERARVIGSHAFFERRWCELGEHFERYAPPDARVALSPIGVFGWCSTLELVDLLGITHTELLDVPPDLAGIRMKGHHRHDAEFVLADPPEYAILGNGVLQPDTGKLHVNPWERKLVTDPRFGALYVQVGAEVAGERAEWFRRRDAPPFPGESMR